MKNMSNNNFIISIMGIAIMFIFSGTIFFNMTKRINNGPSYYAKVNENLIKKV